MKCRISDGNLHALLLGANRTYIIIMPTHTDIVIIFILYWHFEEQQGGHLTSVGRHYLTYLIKISPDIKPYSLGSELLEMLRCWVHL